LTFAGHIPDLDHYSGRGGRVFPLWRDRDATVANIQPRLLEYLAERYDRPVIAEDLVAYIAAVAAHPAFTARFQPDLAQPGLRIPITADPVLFAEAVELGRTVIWLHTFGERFVDQQHARPAQPPRMPTGHAPAIPGAGAISQDPAAFPDSLEYDAPRRRLLVGTGYVEHVSPEVWSYEVSGKQVIRQWFSYRKLDRERPIMGDRRPPSRLGEIQPERWPAEYTTELLNLLNVLGRLVQLEPMQADLLERICRTDTITAQQLRSAGAIADATTPSSPRPRAAESPDQHTLLD